MTEVTLTPRPTERTANGPTKGEAPGISGTDSEGLWLTRGQAWLFAAAYLSVMLGLLVAMILLCF